MKTAANEKYNTAPPWLKGRIFYSTVVGSHAYGVDNADSDLDFFEVCVPPRHYLFPHLNGYIEGFGRQKQNFKVYSQQGLVTEDGRKYDIDVWNIAHFFQGAMDNNPNILEALFVNEYFQIVNSDAAQFMLENKHLFLHKGSYHKFTGFAHSQLAKMIKSVKKERMLTERAAKYAYHAVRLVDELEQILTKGDLVLDSNKKKLREIRNRTTTSYGEANSIIDETEEYILGKIATLQDVYVRQEDGPVPHRPDENQIREVLLECLNLFESELDSYEGL